MVIRLRPCMIMITKPPLSQLRVDETGATTELECRALSLVDDGEGSEGVARRPRPVPSVKAGRSATGTANTEAKRGSLAHVSAGRPLLGPRDPAR